MLEVVRDSRLYSIGHKKSSHSITVLGTLNDRRLQVHAPTAKLKISFSNRYTSTSPITGDQLSPFVSMMIGRMTAVYVCTSCKFTLCAIIMGSAIHEIKKPLQVFVFHYLEPICELLSLRKI